MAEIFSSKACPVLTLSIKPSVTSIDTEITSSSNVTVATSVQVEVDNNNVNKTHNKTRKGNMLVSYFKKKSEFFSRRQIGVLCVLAFVDLLASAAVSIQAPFYPEVASNKGASATEYGLVFGIFEFTSIIASPLFGAKMSVLGPRRVFTAGILTTGICITVFGFLDRIENSSAFIGTCLVIRIMEAIGESAYVTASYTIIAIDFPETVATTFAILETCYALGMILGPVSGGFIYEVSPLVVSTIILGGYSAPFNTMGGLLFVSAVVSMFVLPDKKSSISTHNNTAKNLNNGQVPVEVVEQDKKSLFQFAKTPVVAMTSYGVVATATGLGFLSALLEPHLRQFKLGKTQIGLVFILSGGVYAMTAPFFGWVCDRVNTPHFVTLIGSILTILGFMLIGPLPFIPVDTILWVTCVGLTLFGLGMGGVLVSGFVIYLNDAKDRGFPDDVSTYGYISGLFTAMVSMGYSIGPTVGGILEDTVGFRWGTLFVLGGQFILIGFLLVYFYMTDRKRKNGSESNDAS